MMESLGRDLPHDENWVAFESLFGYLLDSFGIPLLGFGTLLASVSVPFARLGCLWARSAAFLNPRGCRGPPGSSLVVVMCFLS